MPTDRCPTCGKPGAVSLATNGAGPWYCGAHVPNRPEAPKRAPPGIFERLRAELEKTKATEEASE